MREGATGALPENILHFARTLRDAGLPVGPGSALDAIAAAEAVGFGEKADFRAALHAVLVKKHEHSLLFDQLFDIYWKRKGFLETLVAAMTPHEPPQSKPKTAQAGAARVADALHKRAPPPRPDDRPPEADTRLTMSRAEVLQTRDFAQMSAGEIAEARALIGQLAMPDDRRLTRRLAPSRNGSRIDPRRSFRGSLRGIIDLEYREARRRPPPVVALCDISGSMADYTRLFLHFLHVLGQTRRVSTFLFGTRLTNVSRALKHRDPDEALAACSAEAKDWSGGTRIGACLHAFNRDWSRRVLGQGAIVLLFTDGLEREGIEQLTVEMRRLHLSCRRLIWLNPLLRFDGFAAKAGGLRAMLPEVDEFRPIHSLASMGELVRALSGDARVADPKAWLRAG
jgi:uncharacterized protein with von Willebrand factor type A (vWA) domain